MHLQMNTHVDIESDFFREVSENAGLSIEELKNELLNSKIMAVENGHYIRFILPIVHMLFLKDGRMVASDDDNRLEAWLAKNNIEWQGSMVFINADLLAQS